MGDWLTTNQLLERIADSPPKEVIFALNPRVEADTTVDYIREIIAGKHPELRMTRPASGLPVGSDLEFTDAMTLHQALDNRRGV